MMHDDRKGHLYLYAGSNNLEVISKTGVFETKLPLPSVEIETIKYFPRFVFEKTDSSLTLICTSTDMKSSISAEYNLNNKRIDNFEKDPLPLSSPVYIIPDKQGNVWYNNFGEIGYVSRRTGKFYNLTGTIKNKAGEQLTFFNQTVSNDNTIWFCTGSGLIKIYISPSLFQTYLNLPLKNVNDVGASIRGITGDKNGNIWICSYGYPYSCKLYIFHLLNKKSDTIEHCDLKAKGYDNALPPLMKAIFVGESVYAVTDGTLLLKINKKTFQTDALDFSDIISAQFTNITAINDSILWLATLNGMVAFDLFSGQKTIFNNKPGNDFIKNVRVNFFLPAAGNNYWACTLKGIYLLGQDGKILRH